MRGGVTRPYVHDNRTRRWRGVHDVTTGSRRITVIPRGRAPRTVYGSYHVLTVVVVFSAVAAAAAAAVNRYVRTRPSADEFTATREQIQVSATTRARRVNMT